MFKINELILYSNNDEMHTYTFESGINYFKGVNNSGKTEFYKFIDYMFGANDELNAKPWFASTLKKAMLSFTFGEVEYILIRTLKSDTNFLHYAGEEEGHPITLREYKIKLGNIFTSDSSVLKSIKGFTGEELTYRTFTMFNFLGETRQGVMQDFLDKCSEIRYSVKLSSLLNFIFNKNLEEISNLGNELDELLKEIKALEDKSQRHNFVCEQINSNIQKLSLGVIYTGNNINTVKEKLESAKEMYELEIRPNVKNIADLEVMYSNINEQIKIFENSIIDTKQIEKENKNRKLMLEKLNNLIAENSSLSHLIAPLEKLLSELDTTISFSQYIINDTTIKELKKQRNLLKTELKRNEPRFKFYNIEEKKKAFILLENYLSADLFDYSDTLNEKRKRAREIKEQLRILQNTDDVRKIRMLSAYITDLYKSAEGFSAIVDNDIQQSNFKIQYIKRGNSLQPMIEEVIKINEVEEKKFVNYCTGSMARHTLVQLCGYFGFLKILLEEHQYPLIPILAIDHISKPFDNDNIKALGAIINKAINDIGKENLQIFIFDDEEYKTLSLAPNHYEDLVNDMKTGFNPFYTPVIKENVEIEMEKDTDTNE